jgi:uncharacterized protein YydD (DUF2326 family)
MKLSKIYSNLPKIFNPINFNINEFNEGLNVVFAQIFKPEEKKKDSHNLGKTTLIHLIEFCMLKKISNKEHHFLTKHFDRFGEFEFYLEMFLHSGEFVTVKRGVDRNTKISFKKHEEPYNDFTKIGESDWDHFELPIGKAQELLDSYLDLKVISPWSYRKGISYFLRTQYDYQDYFQIQKFVRASHIEWKPYLANLLGFDYKPIKEKYELDNDIEILKTRIKQKQSEIQIDHSEYDKLKNKIQIAQKAIENTTTTLDAFSFSNEEKKINKEIVEQIESEISDINDELYNINYDLDHLAKSISKGTTFDIGAVKELFGEAEILLPDQLVNDYQSLIDFNKQISTDRNAALNEQIARLKENRKSLLSRKSTLNTKRKKLLSIIRDSDTFSKYKKLQNNLADQRAELSFLSGQLERLVEIRKLNKKFRDDNKRLNDLIDELSTYPEIENPTFQAVREEFNALVNRILDLNGLLYIRQNQEGNLEFKIDVEKPGKAGETTSQDSGTSYKKLLCALFDLSLLKVFSDKEFFHFVYHDGVFEGLDNRKRVTLLDTINEYCQDYNIQYMLSVIESDLPRDDKDQKMFFDDEQVVLRLHDKGKDGRLFKMDEF